MATDPGPDADARARQSDARHESVEARMDRNWNELLQELRVTQTGVQILTGFLLTLPFQQRFAELSTFQRSTYLVIVLLAAAATALIVAPVSLHRILFRKHLKRQLVAAADVMARGGLVLLAVVLAGTTLLIFDVVVGRVGGLLAGGAVLTLLIACWLVLPLRLARRAGPPQ